MSWNETCKVKERMKFIAAVEAKEESVSALCRRFSISRKCGHKWITRFNKEGLSGLEDRSRAPHKPHKAMDEVQRMMILKVKCDHMDWGPRKIRAWLEQSYPDICWPAPSSIGELLNRSGLTRPRKRKRHVIPYTEPFGDCTLPNACWSADYKGQTRLRDGSMCYPFTLTDNFSRFIIACDGFDRISGQRVQQVMERAFKEHGLPEAIRTDNGAPFAGRGLGALTRLTVWWAELGIKHERTKPGCPQENGRHERMHATLKKRVPICNNLIEQRAALEAFREEYNYERPHEGINNARPGWVYQPSSRVLPGFIPDAEYDKDFVKRKVRVNGTIKWKGKEVYISEPLAGKQIGLLQISDFEWEIYFGEILLGIFDEKTRIVSHGSW